MEMQGILGEMPRGFFGPFDQTNMIAVQTIFHPGLQGLFFIFEPVKIDMIDLFLLPSLIKYILIDDGKTGASNDIFYRLYITKRMDKGCFH